MSTPKHLRDVVYTLASGDSKVLSGIPNGDYIKVYSATGDFKINLGGGFQRAKSGSVFRGIPYTQIEILDTSGATNEIILKVGTAEYDDSSEVSISGSVSSKPASSSITTTADATVSSSASATLLIGANANRSSVLIQREDSNSAKARLGDSNVTATRGARIKADGELEFNTTAAIYVFQQSGANMTFTITEE